MKKGFFLLVIGFCFYMASSLAAASSFGEQGYMPSWANSSNLITSVQNANNDQLFKNIEYSFDFAGSPDSVDVFFEFIYYRDPLLSGARYSSGVEWLNWPATGYTNYTKLTGDDSLIGSTNWEVVAFSVNLNPGNPGLITVSVDVGSHFDEYFNYPAGGTVGSDNQFIGELYIYARANTSTSAVPEPASLFLLGLGFAGLAGMKRRFKK